jgi:hypothetical protein
MFEKLVLRFEVEMADALWCVRRDAGAADAAPSRVRR